ncbi:MAG TPA: bifunctional (p)ppGpp synthetase/guanosine-3',5'-bis(diphosphate) 3'-pyrophosphohydrolase [Candidatus Caenarcaniphilales bacterium]|nr:bifunctional (p)ppGpp synthetase/guanosine-3',5'-bis(diphosphate) 3'-pyrophosphohydrolase [Candidatus Caenarcaniphilales bacterium]
MSIEPLSPPPTRTADGPKVEKSLRPQAPGFAGRALTAAQRRLEEEVRAHHPQADLGPIREAWHFAVEAHAEQRRASGEPYVTHPVAVAQTLAELGLDPTAIQAALLHDIPEDTDYSLVDLEQRFGREVAQLVDGVTKLSKFGARSHEEQQAESIRKMLLAMAEDIRVVLIKLADRLHNMRTITALPLAKQQRIARQTAEIYAPLAERLGIWQIKWELEDLSFKILEPEQYRRLVDQLESRRRAREAYVRRAMNALREALEASGIKAEISGRPKHISSIWKKMQRKSAEFGEIYDVHAVRVLVDDLRDCYAALGVVHSIWRPIPGQFDDYIAMPKNNMYQSLHTAVVALDGKPLEVQIRTHAMHRISEVGIAAHWRYKEGSKSDRDYDAKLAWVRQLMDWQRDVVDATEFVEGLKLDIFQDQVFVFTPRGDVKDLPAGATPLDFAYRIHTDVGHSCIGAKVNNRLVPLDYKLKNGDIVEIVTTKVAHGPSRDWLNIVQTGHAKEKIRQWFKRQQRDENIVHGRESLDRELRRLARTSLEKLGPEPMNDMAELYRYNSVDDFFAAIGYGAVSPQQVVTKIAVVDDANESVLPQVAPPPPPRTGGVRVKGVGDLMIRFAKCCHAIPGDPIIGYITRGRGVTVHLPTCPTVVNERDVGRLIEVEWEGQVQQTYPIAIRVEAYDRTGLLSEITNVVAENKVNIVAANVRVNPDHTATVQATLQVSSVAQLAKVLSRIEQLKDVHTVQRELGPV